ncbi:MAG: DUF4398 domain-containing protein [Pseudomonadota bacterium]|nr:DUF4398 domain-containing protein [Pseudomonadota bacterium]
MLRQVSKFTKFTQGATVFAIVAGLAACASTPVPNEKIAVAQASVQHAEQAGAPEFAPVELAAAREKLARAQKAAASGDAQPATMLAEQANADAQLAEATAQQQRAHKALTESEANLQALRTESMRNTQPNQ